VLEIVAVVVTMNVWTRIKLAETAMPGPCDLIRRSPRTVLFLDLAGELRQEGEAG
jgi:hypothetical protein